jgi:hypothetical protein
MEKHDSFDETKARIIFEYYKQQREEMMSQGRERLSLTLQLLILLGALAAVFLQTNVNSLKLGISAIVVILGVVGLTLYVNIDVGMRAHVERARAARKSLEFLEEFASVGKFGKTRPYYISIYGLIILVGIVFALSVLLK